MYSNKRCKEDGKAEPRYIETDPTGRYARVSSNSYNLVAFLFSICCGKFCFILELYWFLLLAWEKVVLCV